MYLLICEVVIVVIIISEYIRVWEEKNEFVDVEERV